MRHLQSAGDCWGEESLFLRDAGESQGPIMEWSEVGDKVEDGAYLSTVGHSTGQMKCSLSKVRFKVI